MKIRAFSNFLELRTQRMVLRDTTVVVDGHNLFFDSYEDSGLLHQFGCDSHRYAAYLRQHLAMFQKANVKCYFLLKGGHENMKKTYKKHQHVTIRPIFMQDIYKEVLEEMGFEYVVCEYESKKDIIALAQNLKCPVISQDLEFFFTGLQCILKTQLKFNDRDNSIHCRYYSLEKFMKKFKLTKEKLALFIVLTDEHIFPKGVFLDLFRHLNAPSNNFKRYLHLIHWLSMKSKEELLSVIFRFIIGEDKDRIVQEFDRAELMIGRRESGGLASARLLRRDRERVDDWFTAGVADNHVAVDYVNLYRFQVFFGCHFIIAPPGQDDALVLSLDIVKYAYDLLTNFNNDGFTFVYDTDTERLTMHVEGHPIRKPEYEANVSVFENGWSEVRHLGLLEHFLRESLQRAELRALGWAPRGARLLLAALLYFARRKQEDTSAEAAAVLLSYVMLSTVFEKMDKDYTPNPPFVSKPILSPTTDREDVTEADCNTAAAIIESCLTASKDEVESILDRELLHPLVEFQQCLRRMNHLNALCGAPLAPLELRRAYAGPLVYKLRRAMLGAPPRLFLNHLLSPAPTVLAFFNGLIDVYEEMRS